MFDVFFLLQQTPEEWRLVFYINAVIYAVGLAACLIMTEEEFKTEFCPTSSLTVDSLSSWGLWLLARQRTTLTIGLLWKNHSNKALASRTYCDKTVLLLATCWQSFLHFTSDHVLRRMLFKMYNDQVSCVGSLKQHLQGYSNKQNAHY